PPALGQGSPQPHGAAAHTQRPFGHGRGAGGGSLFGIGAVSVGALCAHLLLGFGRGSAAGGQTAENSGGNCKTPLLLTTSLGTRANFPTDRESSQNILFLRGSL